MQTKIVAITQPLIRIEDGGQFSRFLTPEEFIVYCARVSNPSNQLNTETAPKLLAYCIRNRHWSIFEQVSVTAEIVTSRAIAAQILRHRSFAFQEFSQRYAVATGFEDVELRKQGATNRQGGEEPAGDLEVKMPFGGNISADAAVKTAVEYCEAIYASLVKAGVAKECARMVLPLCTETRLYMTGSLRSWIHYFQVRCDSHAQKEHRDVAEDLLIQLKQHFPSTFEAIFNF